MTAGAPSRYTFFVAFTNEQNQELYHTTSLAVINKRSKDFVSVALAPSNWICPYPTHFAVVLSLQGLIAYYAL